MNTNFDILPEAAHTAALSCRRLIVVHCTIGSSAQLTYYKKDSDGVWQAVLSCDAFIGKAGAGKECEGDMKTPLGTFDLSMPFGILSDPSASDSKGRIIPDYLQINENHYWCGQPGAYYNRLIDNSMPPEGYAPSEDDEHMISYTPSYHYGMVISYNKECIDRKGSAIFLHCTGKKPYTAGCVAIAEEVMREMILDAHTDAKIVIF